MPTYRYRCAKCGEQFEVWQSIHDDSLTAHDGECGGALSKVMGPAGIVLKGSGFYRTDNRAKRSEGGDKPKEKETSSSNGSGDKSDKKDTKKSEAKTPSKSDSSKS
jgi:putative FmdB family regulatory protein